MKKINFIAIAIIFTSTLVFADHKITRGPDIGEIYFIGPTVTETAAIYHSTDFGETATCMDSTLNTNINFMSITADLTPGVIYGFSMPENLYISYNYGEEGSWVFRNNDISAILSGRLEGYIYNGKASHSDDYGVNFINHANNGYFGSLKAVEIDKQDSIGYALTKQYSVYDTLWLLISYDNFENFEIQYTFNWNSTSDFYLTRGFEPGELYLLKSVYTADGSRISELWYSNNYGENWIFKNHLLSNDIVGGRQIGELFVLAEYMQLMGDVKHTFIYHSLDHGETFTVYHPFSYGPSPYFANFEAEPTEGTVPLTVQFTDLSSGDDIQIWEWDFDNDGVIDSYEQNPAFTYQDTGYYSVKLLIEHFPIEDAFIKTNYIHVNENNAVEEELLHISQIELNNYPNPFNPSTIINYKLPQNIREAAIEIYNIKGQLIEKLSVNNHQSPIMWNAEDLATGIYLYKLNINNSPIRKMLLLK